MISFQTIQRAFSIAIAALTLSLAPVQSASAQGLFEALFGGFRRPAPQMPAQAQMPAHATSYADPSGGLFGGESRRPARSGDVSAGGGGGAAFCVRTCDGRFFPLPRGASASQAELCKSFCPSAKTAVYHGSKIDHAVGPGGTRYSDLDNAFTYRERVVDNCTCNGKDAFGLARLNVAADPTLKGGDIVATNEGLTTYNGGRSTSKAAEFTPINPSATEWGKRLAAIKVTPQPEPVKVTPIAEDPKPARNDRRRSVQLTR